MAGAGRRARDWLASFGRRPVALSSPYPVAECLERLAAVTTSRGRTMWYIDPRTVGRPDPLFKGELYRSRTRLTRFAVTGRRGGLVAMLEVRLDPAADGGTALSGWVGVPAGAFQATSFAVLGCLVSLGLLAAGVVQLALGHIIGLVPTLTFPLPAVVFTGVFVSSRPALESEIAALVDQVNEVLGTTGPSKHKGGFAFERTRDAPVRSEEKRLYSERTEASRPPGPKARSKGSAGQVRSRWPPARTARRWC
ncbi:MAG TPA: hypothetical protein VIL16_35355 [Trebonia sp.]